MPGRTRSVLLGLEIRSAGRACNCHGNKRHRILKGEPRLVVKNPGPAAGEDGYCGACAQAMLKAAQDNLAGLHTALDTFEEKPDSVAPATHGRPESVSAPTHVQDAPPGR